MIVKKFISFSAGNQNFFKAGERLISQAANLNLFNEINLYTDDYLKRDPIFFEKHSKFIEENKKGYGYWLWKPYIIKKTIEKMNNGDILLYLDAGCEIDIHEKSFLIECFELVKKDYIIGTLGIGFVKERCKMDLILELGMNDIKYLDSRQHQAGANMYLVCDETRSLVNKWYELCCNYHLIDDSDSINKNLNCFIDHRHDQSIFSLLTKKYNLYSKINLDQLCIKYIRNRSGNSSL
jgi:hypothetical protein